MWTVNWRTCSQPSRPDDLTMHAQAEELRREVCPGINEPFARTVVGARQCFLVDRRPRGQVGSGFTRQLERQAARRSEEGFGVLFPINLHLGQRSSPQRPGESRLIA